MRLRRDEVLDHFVRGQIYHDIRDHPGDYYTAIRERVGISNGVLAFHLHILEKQGFIRGERDGVLKRFYPAGVRSPQPKGLRLSRLQERMLETVRAEPDRSQDEIAKRLGVSFQLIAYNVRVLERLGLLSSRQDGRAVRWSATAQGPDSPVPGAPKAGPKVANATGINDGRSRAPPG